MADQLDGLPGYIIEGKLKEEEGTWYIESPQRDIPVEAILPTYENETVRLTLAGMDELEQLAEQLEEEHGKAGQDSQAGE